MFFYISMLQVQLMKYVITSEITAMFVLPSIIFCYRVFVFMFLFFSRDKYLYQNHSILCLYQILQCSVQLVFLKMNLKQELKVFNVQNITESNLQRNSVEKNFSATDYCVKNSKGSVNYNVRYRRETILYKDGKRQPHSITLCVMRAKNTKKTC